jgi:hypothetical protein
MVDYRRQPVTELGNLFTVVSCSTFASSFMLTTCQARERQPYLAQFENDWATADIVKQFLRSRRKYLVREAKRSATTRQHIDKTDSDEEDMGET